MKRNYNIEAYRIFLVWLICVLHSIHVLSLVGMGCPCLSNLLEWSVPGFVIISGWYGIRFSFQKVLKLYGVCFYCSAVVVLIDWALSGRAAPISDIVKSVYSIATGYWFVNSYVLLMFLAPMVNSVFDGLEHVAYDEKIKALFNICLGIAFLVCVWSFAYTLPYIGKYVPYYKGIEKTSFCTLLAVYAFTRSTKMIVKEEKVAGWIERLPSSCLIAIFVGVLFVAGMGLGDINGPFALVIAMGSFYCFNKMHMPKSLDVVIGTVSPSVFAIYLLHTNRIAWNYMQLLGEKCTDHFGNRFVAYLIVATVAFVIGLMLDTPRRSARYVIFKIKDSIL